MIVRGALRVRPRYLIAVALSGVLIAATAIPSGAAVAPRTPAFGPSIDGYSPYQAERGCASVVRPGVVAIRDQILKATYGSSISVGTLRACGIGGPSGHKEGRAFDYMLNTPTQRANGQAFLNWLLATDVHGNRHAMARRLGVMYIIHDHKIWRSYRASRGWQPYTGPNPHTGHIHVSLSWAGADKRTSYWTAAPPRASRSATRTPTPAKCTTLYYKGTNWNPTQLQLLCNRGVTVIKVNAPYPRNVSLTSGGVTVTRATYSTYIATMSWQAPGQACTATRDLRRAASTTSVRCV